MNEDKAEVLDIAGYLNWVSEMLSKQKRGAQSRCENMG
jgi:hypothetical protein